MERDYRKEKMELDKKLEDIQDIQVVLHMLQEATDLIDRAKKRLMYNRKAKDLDIDHLIRNAHESLVECVDRIKNPDEP
ncbi:MULTISPECIES: hypothetical protein [Paenibacillus]|uniref:Uncharacterized protein n=1 Tax=Paenibacillus polymyxa (strain SC2) TaxID=886882 RepID=E3EKH8_PAEPS|nr:MULTISPECIES: hypothetical protein [Paenibacillus]ADO59810.1 hypothetical protein PPSC2_26110 [Paenibacillus polymyxa SC2]MBP1309060.1 hypothetical protein [Paenibacillus sp. 1182]WPQ59955.1 hypothetical protein SKN87_27315 [Paenibacillus polymyxa]